MRYRRLGIAMLSAACSVGSAYAQGLYAGATAGVIDPDVDGFDDVTNAGLLLGYAFTDAPAAFAVEGGFTTSVSDADVSIGSASGEWDVDTAAVEQQSAVVEAIERSVTTIQRAADDTLASSSGNESVSAEMTRLSDSLAQLVRQFWLNKVVTPTALPAIHRACTKASHARTPM